MKMEAVCSSETLSTYISTRRYSPEDQRRYYLVVTEHGTIGIVSLNATKKKRDPFYMLSILCTAITE
jgi:hypothetical protein